jgi:hypothetical protein
MLKAHTLKIYTLKKSSDRVLRNLINKARLIKININNLEHL